MKLVETMTSEVAGVCQKLFLNMEMNKTIGANAKDIGSDFNIIAIKSDRYTGAMINVGIMASYGLQMFKERCTKLAPEFAVVTQRPMEILVKFQDVSGTVRELSFVGEDAANICHQVDHLNDVTIKNTGVFRINSSDDILRF